MNKVKRLEDISEYDVNKKMDNLRFLKFAFYAFSLLMFGFSVGSGAYDNKSPMLLLWFLPAIWGFLIAEKIEQLNEYLVKTCKLDTKKADSSLLWHLNTSVWFNLWPVSTVYKISKKEALALPDYFFLVLLVLIAGSWTLHYIGLF